MAMKSWNLHGWDHASSQRSFLVELIALRIRRQEKPKGTRGTSHNCDAFTHRKKPSKFCVQDHENIQYT
jgi:hypothetical protein